MSRSPAPAADTVAVRSPPCRHRRHDRAGPLAPGRYHPRSVGCGDHGELHRHRVDPVDGPSRGGLLAGIRLRIPRRDDAGHLHGDPDPQATAPAGLHGHGYRQTLRAHAPRQHHRGGDGAATPVDFTAIASNIVDFGRAWCCTPASRLRLRSAPRRCQLHRYDAHGNSASGSFTGDDYRRRRAGVTLPATSPPRRPARRRRCVHRVAADLVDGSRTVTCTPASGSGSRRRDPRRTAAPATLRGNARTAASQ